jgi:hypothetical protein
VLNDLQGWWLGRLTNDPSRFGWFPPNVVSVQTIDREIEAVAVPSSAVADLHSQKLSGPIFGMKHFYRDGVINQCCRL